MTGSGVHSFKRPAALRTGSGVAPGFGAAFIGRQPILDASMATYGYELLYRRAGQSTATCTDRDAASAEVALDGFLEFGLEALARSKRAFLNISRSVLLSGFCRELPAEGVVIELLEDLECDADVLRAVAELADAGYEIALDDYVEGDGRVSLLPWTSIVKIDIEGRDTASLAQQTLPLRALGIRLVAERVETPEQLASCRALGFTYFQGFFFARPSIVKGRRIPVEQITALRVLAQLSDPNSSVDAVTEEIARDVKLSYQLLRAANSAATAHLAPVDSLPQAMMRIGRNQLRGWITVLGLAGIDGKPPAVLTTALLRARMCEGLALAASKATPASWFMAGLLSSLDMLFDAPIERTIADLRLSPQMVDALVRRSGELGQALDAVIAFERGDWAKVRCAGLTARDFTAAYRSALEWLGEWEQHLAA